MTVWISLASNLLVVVVTIILLFRGGSSLLGLLPLLAGLVTLSIVYNTYRKNNDRAHQEFIRWLIFSFKIGKFAWSLGTSVSTVLLGFYLFIPSKDILSLQDRLAMGIPMFIGTIAAVLGLHFLYKRIAPITYMEELMESIIRDIKKVSRSHPRFWIVYPALNLGHYRSILELGPNLPDDHIYPRYSQAIVDAVGRALKHGAHAVTYPIMLYDDLWTRYDEVITESTDTTRISNCTGESIELANSFINVDQNGDNQSQIPHFTELSPEYFPEHVIIIGDISYSIMSYGIPVFRPDKNHNPDTGEYSGAFVGGEKEPATLLAYRKEDPALADTIVSHLERLVRVRTEQNRG